MKTRTFALAALALAFGYSAQADFTGGNLAVLRIGDGTETLGSSGNSVFIDQYSTLGNYVNSIGIPNSGASALVMSGSASSEGSLTRSVNGSYLTFIGYNTTAGIPNATALPNTGSTMPRVVGQVNGAGTYSAAFTTTTVFNGSSGTAGNPRSVISDGAGNYWGVGTANTTGSRGTYYFGSTQTAGWLEGTKSPRVINIQNGNLYYSVSSGTAGASGIWGFSGTPTTGPLAATQVIDTGANSGNYDFAFNPLMTFAYVADDRSSGGGIQRWDKSGSTWSLSYTISTGSVGARGLAVDFSGSTPVIFATTAETSNNRLVEILDVGAGSTVNLLASAGANKVFRGLDFAPIPVPEPTSAALLGLGLLLCLRRHLR